MTVSNRFEVLDALEDPVEFKKYTRLTVGQLKYACNFTKKISSAGGELSYEIRHVTPRRQTSKPTITHMTQNYKMNDNNIYSKKGGERRAYESSPPAEEIFFVKLQAYFN